MGALHQIEASQGAALAQQAPIALDAARRALGLLQAQPASVPAVTQAMEAIAGSLSLVHQLMQAANAPPAVPPAQAVLGGTAVIPPGAGSGQAQPHPAMPAQPAADAGWQGARPPSGQPQYGVPSQGAGVPQQPQGYPPAQQAPAQQYAQPPAQQYAQPPAQQYAQPPAVQQHSPQPQAAYPQAPQYAQPQAPQPPYAQQPAQPQAPQYAQQPAHPNAQAPGAQPQPYAQQPPAAQPPAAAAAGQLTVEADLGAHSATNFYKGLSGNDVIDSGGIFIATYQIPEIGQQLTIKVSLPGGYEFEAQGVVRWTRDAPMSGAGVESPPGYGAQFTNISQEGRQLVYRYVRNREPLFHDDL
jgi:hypothetical protein